MENFISFVNEHLSWEEDNPQRNDCHDPPHATPMGFVDDRFVPRRLAGVARSGPWRSTPAEMGFPMDASRRRISPWVAESDLWCNNRREKYLRKHQSGEDRHRVEVICALARFGMAMIVLEGFVFACEPKGYFVSNGSLYAGLIALM
jgi:hypothetical protein